MTRARISACIRGRALLDRYPAFELRGDLEIAVNDGLKVVAEELETAVQRIRSAESRNDDSSATGNRSAKGRR